jgi:parallel beta-helix repeat protein
MKKGMYYFTVVCVMLLVSTTFVGATTIKSLPYEITTRGYYKINTNLTSTGTGITVKANNVTIDLNGYTIAGKGTGSYNGIYLNGRSNVEIRNGTIRDFGSNGIYEEGTSGNSHRVINIRVMNNKGCGIYLYGSNHIVKDCTVSNNENSGIVMHGSGSAITGNTAYANGGTGIDGGIGCTITGNTAYANGGSGIYASFGSTVKNNTTYYNQYYGIYLNVYILVDGNTALDNNQSGGSYTNISPCGTCTFGVNVRP